MSVITVTKSPYYLQLSQTEVTLKAGVNSGFVIQPPVSYNIDGQPTLTVQAGQYVSLSLDANSKNWLITGGNFYSGGIPASQITGTKTSSFISDFAAAVRSTKLTGLSSVAAAAITAADSVLTALEKLQAQIDGFTAAVTSVFGRTGDVTAEDGDYTASQITNVPSGGVDSTTVQAAINELDTDKAAKTVTISTTAPLGGGGNLSTNRTLTITKADSTTDGYLSSSDWSTFNGKAAASGTTNQLAYFNGSTSLASLTTATYPSLTEISYVKGVTSAIQTQLDSKLPATSLVGYTLQFYANTYNPLDATTYYLGQGYASTPNTVGATRRIYVPKTGTVKAIYMFFLSNAGGSNETSTISLRLNNTTDTTISSTLSIATAQVALSNSALSLSVTAGDYLEIKWVTPTWTSNPAALFIWGTIYIE